MRQSSATVAVLALLAAAAVVAADPAPPAGYTKREDANHPFIRQVGRFAVNVYRLAYTVDMYYARTLQCWSAPAGGGVNFYWMVLTATNGTTGATGKYVCTVSGIPGSRSTTWKLYSFNTTN